MSIAGARHLEGLEARIAAGAALMPAGFLGVQAGYLRESMLDGGGFPGRAGGEDVYYTCFGLRAAELAGIREAEFWARAADGVDRRGAEFSGTVECFSVLASARIIRRRAPGSLVGEFSVFLSRAAAAHLEAVSGAGASESAGADPALYATFLCMLSWGMLGKEMPNAGAVLDFVNSRRRADGGFSDAQAEGSGINQTAAAVSILAAAGVVTGELAAGTGGFIASMQRAEGGLSAHVAAPGPDLLSTFTGLVAAGELSCLDRLRLGDVARFARALVCEGGGFRGALSDDRPDVEYTYYGLGAVAVLAGLAAGASCCSECSCRAGGRAARPGAT